MAHLRGDKAYVNWVTCELRPGLRRLPDAEIIPWSMVWGLRRSPAYYGYFADQAVALGGSDAREIASRPDVRDYMDAVEKAAAHFRLVHRRRPAEWAIGFIHADCMAAPGEAPRDDALWAAQYRYRFERSLTLSVAADAGHAAIWRTLEHPAPGVAGWGLRPVERDLRLVRRSATTPADEAVPYSYWAELEREIDRQVAAFKSQLRAAMEPEDDSDTRVRYAHTLARRPHQVRKLFHLLHPDYHDPETLGQLARKNLGRIAAVIGVDLPPSDIAARRKVARKPL